MAIAVRVRGLVKDGTSDPPSVLYEVTVQLDVPRCRFAIAPNRLPEVVLLPAAMKKRNIKRAAALHLAEDFAVRVAIGIGKAAAQDFVAKTARSKHHVCKHDALCRGLALIFAANKLSKRNW